SDRFGRIQNDRRDCHGSPVASSCPATTNLSAREVNSAGRSAMPAIRIDRTKPLAQEPRSGHNRYHPDIEPVLEVREGEEVVLETRDALDGALKPGATVADFDKIDVGAVHPLTGPVLVKGAKPGDMLEIEFLDIAPQPTSFSAIVPGLGFLRDVMTEPFLVHWKLRDGWATSEQIP